MIASGINLVMTVIGFAVSTMFIVFVCTRLVCARIQLNASRRAFPTASRSDLSLLERGLHGLEPVVVATFPTQKYSHELSSCREDVQCTVCLAEYQDKDILRFLPYCGHSFHVACIDRWLQQHSTCPVCRISLRPSPERKHVMQPMYSSAVRSPDSMDSLNSRSFQYLCTGHGLSSRAIDNQRMEPIQEDLFISEVDGREAGEGVSICTEDNHSSKNVGLHGVGSKRVESPSNT